MFGSIFYNLWFALLSFTVYFLARFQTNQSPLSIILYGLLWAVIGFLMMYIIRALIGYIMYSPEPEEAEESASSTPQIDKDITDDPEDIAKAIQNAMKQDDINE